MAKAAAESKKKSKPKGISIRLELTSADYDVLMEMSEVEKRSIRGQAQYMVESGLRQWREAKGKK